MISRRSALAALLACAAKGPAGVAASGDFWNAKRPADWSAQEVRRLRTNSPWAREGVAQLASENMGGAEGQRGRKGDRVPYGGPNGTGLAGVPSATEPVDGRPKIKVLIRWESAEPILAAAPGQASADAAKFYVVSVAGFLAADASAGHGPTPASVEARDPRLEQVMRVTFLLCGGRDPIAATDIHMSSFDGVVSFYFPREGAAITAADKEVVFVSKLGPLELRVKFPLKPMLYRGRLAL